MRIPASAISSPPERLKLRRPALLAAVAGLVGVILLVALAVFVYTNAEHALREQANLRARNTATLVARLIESRASRVRARDRHRPRPLLGLRPAPQAPLPLAVIGGPTRAASASQRDYGPACGGADFARGATARCRPARARVRRPELRIAGLVPRRDDGTLAVRLSGLHRRGRPEDCDCRRARPRRRRRADHRDPLRRAGAAGSGARRRVRPLSRRQAHDHRPGRHHGRAIRPAEPSQSAPTSVGSLIEFPAGSRHRLVGKCERAELGRVQRGARPADRRAHRDRRPLFAADSPDRGAHGGAEPRPAGHLPRSSASAGCWRGRTRRSFRSTRRV